MHTHLRLGLALGKHAQDSCSNFGDWITSVIQWMKDKPVVWTNSEKSIGVRLSLRPSVLGS